MNLSMSSWGMNVPGFILELENEGKPKIAELSDFVWTSYGNSPYLIVALHEDRRLYVLLCRLYNFALILGRCLSQSLQCVYDCERALFFR